MLGGFRARGNYFIVSVKALLFVCLAGVALTGGAAVAGKQDDIIKKLQERYEKIRTVEADFTQVTKDAFGVSTTSKGRVYLKKPGMMRWDYLSPVKDRIISNGRVLWFYQPDLNQAIKTVVRAGASGIAKDFLSGVGSIERVFRERKAGKEGGVYIIELTPKDDRPDMESLTLKVRESDLIVLGFIVTDRLGNRTGVDFSAPEINGEIPDSVFEFKAPDGVVVIKR